MIHYSIPKLFKREDASLSYMGTKVSRHPQYENSYAWNESSFELYAPIASNMNGQ
jgi:hypothetical protein